MTSRQRSYNMSMIRSIDTKPELKAKAILTARGYTYHPFGIYGKPDFANQKGKIAVFVDGCFWHRCPKDFVKPITNQKFWLNKIEKNVKRDKIVNTILKKEGWRVIRVWEHQLKTVPSHAFYKQFKYSSNP